MHDAFGPGVFDSEKAGFFALQNSSAGYFQTLCQKESYSF